MPKGMGCCGALTHHMGREHAALAFAKANIDAWTRELDEGGLDAVVINASGCGTTVKDYGFMLREDPAYAEKAARIAALTKDITEILGDLGLPPATTDTDLVVAYHSACSMQHGQKITGLPKQLLTQAGFTVKDPPEGHLCCGSAGTYNLLQPEIAGRLRDRKVANIESTGPQVIATGNIGCITQIGVGHGDPRRAHGRAARLGDGRAKAGSAGRIESVTNVTKPRDACHVHYERRIVLTHTAGPATCCTATGLSCGTIGVRPDGA